MSQEKKVAIVSRAWYPHHQILFDEIQSQLGDEIKLHYYLLSRTEKNRPWDVKVGRVLPRIIPGIQFKIFSKEIMINTEVNKYLSDLKPSLIIITPWSEIGCFIAKNYAKRNKFPSIAWTVGLRDWHPSLTWKIRSCFSKMLTRNFLKGHEYIFAYGTKAKNDAVKMGVPEEKIVIVKLVIDENHFDFKKIALSEDEKLLKRREFLLDERPLFICISQLVPRKGIVLLLNAYRLLLQKNKDVQLLLIGNGPEMNIVKNYCQDYKNNFKWIPFVPYSDIPLFYAISDFSLVTSYFDDWCTVVNESHCAKVPVICSDGAHASYDLIKHGHSGLVFKAGDVNKLVELMEYALNNHQHMKMMAQNGYNFIHSEWNTKESAKIWAKYINKALNPAIGRQK